MTDREMVMERLRFMYIDFDRYMSGADTPDSSAGMVVKYGAVIGGRTNRISDHTSSQAIRSANISRKDLERKQWLECTWNVFVHFITQHRAREKVLGHVLYHKAFLGWTYARIAEEKMPGGAKVSRQRIYEYYMSAVDAVAVEAVKLGLIKRDTKQKKSPEA